MKKLTSLIIFSFFVFGLGVAFSQDENGPTKAFCNGAWHDLWWAITDKGWVSGDKHCACLVKGDQPFIDKHETSSTDDNCTAIVYTNGNCATVQIKITWNSQQPATKTLTCTIMPSKTTSR